MGRFSTPEAQLRTCGMRGGGEHPPKVLSTVSDLASARLMLLITVMDFFGPQKLGILRHYFMSNF